MIVCIFFILYEQVLLNMLNLKTEYKLFLKHCWVCLCKQDRIIAIHVDSFEKSTLMDDNKSKSRLMGDNIMTTSKEMWSMFKRVSGKHNRTYKFSM